MSLQPSRNDVPGARALALAAALVLVTLVVYWPVVGSEFVNLDDDRYVTANPHVQRGLSLVLTSPFPTIEPLENVCPPNAVRVSGRSATVNR